MTARRGFVASSGHRDNGNGARARRVYDLLKQVPLFSDLPDENMESIVRGCTDMHVARGEVVFHRGDPCVGFHIVVYGRIKLVFVSAAGVERVVRIVGPGEGFGEALMFMEQDYIVTAVALADTLLLHVGREALFEQLERQPGVARKMLAGLSRRLYSLMGDVEAYTLHSGTQRLIAYLLQEAPAEQGQPFRIEISKTVIASRLNLTPAHFSRILRELGDRGLLRVRGREYKILDTEGLRSYHE